MLLTLSKSYDIAVFKLKAFRILLSMDPQTVQVGPWLSVFVSKTILISEFIIFSYLRTGTV